MSAKVDACYTFLELLAHTYRMAPRTARALLLDMKRDQILCIAELILNTLAGNLKISDQPQKELARFKTMMRKVERIIELPAKEEKTKAVPQAASDVHEESMAHTATAHNGRARSSRARSLCDRTSNSRRTSPSTRERLRELFVKHYHTVAEFIKICLPYLQDIGRR